MGEVIDKKENWNSFFQNSTHPLKEASAYETLWNQSSATYKTIRELFLDNLGSVPSDLIMSEIPEEIEDILKKEMEKVPGSAPVFFFFRNSFNYPKRLLDAKYPIEGLYCQGKIEYLKKKSVSIVGTRNPTPEGVKRAMKLSRLLVEKGYYIMSGLAKGIDTAAHTAAIKANGRTIAVIGTPLSRIYPKENAALQAFIAENHLIVSPVPFVRYSNQNPKTNRFFFPERNKVMSALSEATIIVEASNTSGTLVQARAALEQGRKLFILESNFHNPEINWPTRFLEKGAIRVKELEDITRNLENG